MAWIWAQLEGTLWPAGHTVPLAKGYSGSPGHVNDPASQALHNEGPIPQGLYTVGSPEDTQDHGPYVLRLTPDPANEMFGRSGFLIHGDSIAHPGTASEGCIILARAFRQSIWASNDHRLQVVESKPEIY